MNWLERWHGTHVHTRRVRVLATTLAPLLPPQATVLDIGCGDGRLAVALAAQRPDATLAGVELAPRPDCPVPVTPFDGRRLPFPDGSFDVALLVDVLHHTADPAVLLREAGRVARAGVLLKDHFRNGLGARATLRFMDEIGNRRHGVALPFNYLSREEWRQLFDSCALTAGTVAPLRDLYPFPASLLFGRGLHFLTHLRRRPPDP